MPDLFNLFQRWWKQIVSLIIIVTIAAGLVLILVPREYLAVATALPAPSFASDKTAVFGQNLQALYPALGTPDDLDNVIGTAHLDTVYVAVAAELKLPGYYKLEGRAEATRRAAWLIKKRTRVIKNDYGELQVKVWDHDRVMAAAMANAVMNKLQQMHQDVQSVSNAAMLARVNEVLSEKKLAYQQLADSPKHIIGQKGDLASVGKASLEKQIQDYDQLADEYRLMVEARPQVLIVIEKASPPLRPDIPRAWTVLTAAAILGLLFGILTALFLERRKSIQP